MKLSHRRSAAYPRLRFMAQDKSVQDGKQGDQTDGRTSNRDDQLIVVCRLATPGFLNPLIAAAMAFSSVFVVTYCLGRRRFQPAVGLADTYLACLVTGLG